jgi:hypothetical protein
MLHRSKTPVLPAISEHGELRMKFARLPACPLLMLVLLATAVQLAGSALGAQFDEPNGSFFSLEQKVKIAQIVTRRTRPLADVGFPVAVERLVPWYVDVQDFPPDAQSVGGRIDDLGYIIVDELIAIVDRHSRKIVSVFPKWGDLRHLIQ